MRNLPHYTGSALTGTTITLQFVNLPDTVDQSAKLEERIQSERSSPFDLGKGPLIRALLIEIKDDETVLLITQHHIISDGWSSGIMLRELSQLYRA
ncbi:hypothetical protein BGZ72_001644, partial [Mortierella alpina]